MLKKLTLALAGVLLACQTVNAFPRFWYSSFPTREIPCTIHGCWGEYGYYRPWSGWRFRRFGYNYFYPSSFYVYQTLPFSAPAPITNNDGSFDLSGFCIEPGQINCTKY